MPTKHGFRQDPNEDMDLCSVCGYWPEHHNHPGERCSCQECVQSPHGFRDFNMYMAMDTEARWRGGGRR